MRCQLAIRVFVFFLNRTPQVHDMLEGWSKTLQFDLEGEPSFNIVVRDERAKVNRGPANSPDVIFSAPAKLFLRMIIDDVNADEAYINKKYEVIGQPADATRFRVLGERVQLYRPRLFALLRRLGPVAMRLR